MKVLKACAVVAVLGLATNMAPAALLVADGFNYPTGALSGNADADYAANPATWQLTGASGSDPTVVAGNLTYAGTGAPANLPGANSASTNTLAGASRIQLATPVSGGTFTQAGNAGQTLYYSFLLNVSDVSSLASSAAGSFIAGFNNSVGAAGSAPTADAGVLCIRRDSSTSTTFHLGIAQQQASGRTYAPASYATGDTLFVVAAYNFGATAGTDSADLYVFDGGAGDAIPAAQPGTSIVHGSYTAEINASVDNIVSFFLRDNGVAATTQIDDLRIGTSWADVTGAVPEPTTVSLAGLGALGMLLRRRRQQQGA
jgi:hypothetical protein